MCLNDFLYPCTVPSYIVYIAIAFKDNSSILQNGK